MPVRAIVWAAPSKSRRFWSPVTTASPFAHKKVPRARVSSARVVSTWALRVAAGMRRWVADASTGV
ncbi:MAG: hypothetical protein ABIR82_07435 [Nocardioides sp.]